MEEPSIFSPWIFFCKFKFIKWDEPFNRSYKTVHFYQRPFQLIALFLVIGIATQHYLGVSLALSGGILGISGLVSLLLWRLGYDKNWGFISILFFAFVALGITLSAQEKTGEWENRTISSTQFYTAEVLELGKTDVRWKKAICDLTGIVRDESLQPIRERVLLIINADNLREGDQLFFSSRMEFISNKGNPGEFDAVHYWRSKGVQRIGFLSEDDFKLIASEDPPFFKSLFRQASSYLGNVLSTFLSDSELSVAKALVLGDKSMLTQETKAQFSNAGAMHVLAVSGLHVGIVMYLLISIFGRFPRIFSRNGAFLLAVILIWIYAGITGFSPSVLRSTFMFSVLVLGQLVSKKSDGLNTLFLTAVVMLLLNPLLLYDIGFQLSYLAMIGILNFYKPISELLNIKNKWLRKMWEGTAVGIAAQLTTVPLTLYYFHQFPNYFALTNIGMMVFAGLVLGFGVVLLVTHWIGFLATFLGFGLLLLVGGMIYFIQFVDGLPFATAQGFKPTLSLAFAMYTVLTFFLFFGKQRRIQWWVGTILLFFFFEMQYQRYTQMNDNHLVVFNSNKPIIALKASDRIFCFYQKNNDQPNQRDFLIQAYAKVYPGEVTYFPLDRNEWNVEIERDLYTVKNEGKGIAIQLKDKQYFVRTDYSSIPEGAEVIDLPYLNSGHDNYNLQQGAFQISL